MFDSLLLFTVITVDGSQTTSPNLRYNLVLSTIICVLLSVTTIKFFVPVGSGEFSISLARSSRFFSEYDNSLGDKVAIDGCFSSPLVNSSGFSNSNLTV